MALQILTANRLSDGISVWYDVDGRWSESIARAEIARNPDEVARLEAIGKQAFTDNLVLDVNMIDVEETDGFIRPLRLRERIRAEGPTIDYVI
jgi:hypothetical protein